LYLQTETGDMYVTMETKFVLINKLYEILTRLLGYNILTTT